MLYPRHACTLEQSINNSHNSSSPRDKAASSDSFLWQLATASMLLLILKFSVRNSSLRWWFFLSPYSCSHSYIQLVEKKTHLGVNGIRCRRFFMPLGHWAGPLPASQHYLWVPPELESGPLISASKVQGAMKSTVKPLWISPQADRKTVTQLQAGTQHHPPDDFIQLITG